MIVDTSALLALILREPDFERIDEALNRASHPRMSAGTLLELGILVDRRLPPAQRARVERLLREYRLQIEPVTEHQAEIGRAAYELFGKGSGSRAQLNFGDCFAYALAAETGEPLLFVGDDFTHTDLTPALPTNQR
ncbi:MAG TPA: type II toxin-antitoxin system VapC family toxin [Dermatophilaceae bacterium]|nr:type II toxin-antitoxin system VapC family toxin [Dermatophilaceae bacterium]